MKFQGALLESFSWRRDLCQLAAVALVFGGTFPVLARPVRVSLGLFLALAELLYGLCILVAVVGIILEKLSSPVRWQEGSFNREADGGQGLELGGCHWRVIREYWPLKRYIFPLPLFVIGAGTIVSRIFGRSVGTSRPLLANILLDDLDKELEKRGRRFARYADDCASRMPRAV